MINSLYAHAMTMAQAQALDRANLDLVVARVEDDVLEIDAPAVDVALGVGEAVGGDNVVADNPAVDDGGADGPSGTSSSSEVEVSEDESILTDDSSEVSLPSTSSDDDNDSIISEPGSPRRTVTNTAIAPVVANAIVGDDHSAEADANAEVESIENRLNESVPWENYYAPAPDGGDDDGDDDGGDDGNGAGDDDELDLRPEEREQLRFDTNLAVRLRTFEETQTVDPMLVQMLTHG